MAFFTSNISFSRSFFLFLLASAVATCLSTSPDPLSVQRQDCIYEHFSALLRLKRGFHFPFPNDINLSSWDPHNRDCCTWEGIACDAFTGHVTSVDLSEFGISGQIDFQSLSSLRSLHILNLANNRFDPSPIPSAIGQLDKLTFLDLSSGSFYGKIPVEMSSLTRLVSLDLSSNEYYDGADFISLKVEKPSIGALIQNMSSLRELYLDGVNMSTGGSKWSEAISSALPNLRKLSMVHCGLSGPIHPSFFHLPFLSQLDLSHNNLFFTLFNSTGNFSSFKSLTQLSLQNCNMSGPLPSQLANFTRLEQLDLSGNSLSGSIPSSYGNHLLNLKQIFLDGNLLNGTIPSSLLSLPSLLSLRLQNNQLGGHLNEFHNASSSPLEFVDLSNNKLQGMIPRSIFQLRTLLLLNLRNNQLGGHLNEFHNASSSPLGSIDLSNNKLQGMIPRSFFLLRNLNFIYLYSNNFSDALDLGLFLNLTALQHLALSNIDLSVMDIKSNSTSISFPQLSILYLRSCNIKRFPDFLRNQWKMWFLDLSGNQIDGEIPMWIWNVGNGSLDHLNLSHNALQAIQSPTPNLSLRSLTGLDLSSNALEGLLPVPSSLLLFYSVSKNNLSGEIPMSICNLTSLELFDVSDNNFSGRVPQCFGEMSNALAMLHLRGNAFNGSLPQTFKQNCSLKTLDFSRNQFEGQMPISISNCKGLMALNLKSNQIHDAFPSWIQDLAELRILDLGSNHFYGPIELPQRGQNFSTRLQIMDLSSNNFNSSLPSTMFRGWMEMTGQDKPQPEYLGDFFNSSTQLSYCGLFCLNVVITSKSLEMVVSKIRTDHTVLDLSNNHFQGQIPESIGILKLLRVLNMSHNQFTGRIPVSMKNLTALESLDLSQNNISGRIPQELLELTFLAVLNLSGNQLTGAIPHGKQFSTFTDKSFEGNPELCGFPLPKQCGDANDAPPPISTDEELLSESEYNWKMVAMGFGIGYGVGLGVFCWTLVLWTKGRRAYNKYVNKLLLLLFPSAM